MSDVDPLIGATKAVQTRLDEISENMGELDARDLARTALVGGGFASALDQPTPEVGDEAASVHTHLIEFIQASPLLNHQREWAVKLCDRIAERRAFGLRKYGTVLHTDDGRSTFGDWIAELLDALAYSQKAVEQSTSEKSQTFTQTRRLRLIQMCLDLIEEEDRVRRQINRPGRSKG